jgi:hypothetical protein
MFRVPQFYRLVPSGTIALATIVALCSLAIARAGHVSPDKTKTFTCSMGTCVEGNASGSATDGVYGSSSGNGTHGVYGINTAGNAAVLGTTTSTNGGSGVSGVSTATSGSANGVYGRASSLLSGVQGVSYSDNGIVGVTTANGPAGIYGDDNKNGDGVVAESYDRSGKYSVIAVRGETSETMLFEAYNEATGGDCFISAFAAMTCSGGVSAPALNVRHRTSAGQRVASYASESASPTIEDDGTARISDGVAMVQIDPAFASIMDHKWYYVFLTPLADTRGLYVSAKTAEAFQVRETAPERGGTLAFDYRIVAHPRDRRNDRLPPAPAVSVHQEPSRLAP